MRYFPLFILSLATIMISASSFAQDSQVVMPDRSLVTQDWQTPLNDAGIGVKPFYNNADISTHLLTLAPGAAEKPHVHDRHDLIAIVSAGTMRIHFKNHHKDLAKGDITIIPKGTYHWAENIGQQPNQSFVIFAPPFDGTDRRFVTAPPQEN